MRTLSKLQHEQFRDARTAPEVQENERQIVVQQEKGVWRRRLRGLRKAVIVCSVGYLALLFLVGWGRSADGLARAPRVEVLAPGLVRVVEVYTAAGEPVAMGDPLLRLEPVSDLQRDVFEASLKESEGRLALVKAGAGLDGVDAGRGVDRLVEAELALNEAETAWQQARVKARELERSRDQTEAALGQDWTRLAGAVGVLHEQLVEAEANLRQAQATRTEAEELVLRQTEVGGRGAASGAAVDAAYAGRTVARAEVASRMAAVGAVRQALAAASSEHAQDGGRADAALDVLQASVDAGWLAVERAKAEVFLRRQVVQQRRDTLPETSVSAAEIRSLEVERLEAEVAGRRAALAAHDVAVGRTLVRARVTGVVDLVGCEPGQILREGDLVVSCFDPESAWVDVWVDPDLAADLREELADAVEEDGVVEVSLVGDGGGVSVVGHVVAVGRAWERLPRMLGAENTGRPDLYCQVKVRPLNPQELAPDMRIRAVFQ